MAVLAGTKTSVATEVPSRLNSSVLNNSGGKLKHLHRIPGFILLSSFCFEIKSPVVMKEVWSVEEVIAGHVLAFPVEGYKFLVIRTLKLQAGQ